MLNLLIIYEETLDNTKAIIEISTYLPTISSSKSYLVAPYTFLSIISFLTPLI